MKRLALKGLNYCGYLVTCGLVGRLIGTLAGAIFKDFLQDEDYAENHPKKYLLGVLAIVSVAMLITYLVIYWPLNYLMKAIDSKIDAFADDKEWD